MNVLLYNDEGASVESVRQTYNCLQEHLSPKYVVSTVSARQLIEEPWAPYTSLLVIPGGADIPYCKLLNGAGNKAIQNFVRKGGHFLGICAGSYYGTTGIEFEIGTPIEVSGPRELGFYKGKARGTVFKGFNYNDDTGARAALLATPDNHTFTGYYNGGCLFEGDDEAEVLARYVPPFDIESEIASPAACVYNTYGKGSYVLTGVHIEAKVSLDDASKRSIPAQVVAELERTKVERKKFLDFIFREKFGLKVPASAGNSAPELSPLYLSSLNQKDDPNVKLFMHDLVLSMDAETSTLQDKTDTFQFLKSGIPPQYAGFGKEIIAANGKKNNIVSENPQPKTVFVYDVDSMYPPVTETPYFNHELYYRELTRSIAEERVQHGSHLGGTLMYGAVVTSTSTMLERNPTFLKYAPDGLVVCGTQQVSGRGRGNNVWVNPIGVLACSGVIRIKRAQCNEPLAFIQYICALALLRAIKTFLPSGADIGLRLKWPNDIYMFNRDGALVKVGGLMVSCNVVGDEFVVVFGSGTNLNNSEPTMSINDRIRELGIAQPIQMESLLARFVTIFDKITRQFLVSGFSIFSKEYYGVWMHTDAKVTLERYANVQAKIQGISLTNGMLVAVDEEGHQYELQPDGNSFDVLRGLIRRKQ